MDVIRDLAHRLPVIVICDMLGIPEDHRAAFLVGSNVSGRILDPAPMTREELDQRQHRHRRWRNDYFDQLCELRRREPQDDLTTELVRAEEAGDRLTTEELQANIGLLFGAGHETTTNLIGNGLLALHRAPDQWQRLKDDPSLIPNAVEELLRYDSSVQMTGRVTMTEVEVGGVTLPAERERASCCWARPTAIRRSTPIPTRSMSAARTSGRCRSAAASIIAWARSSRGSRPSSSSPPWSSACRTSSCRRRTRPPGGGTFTLRGLHKLPAIWH